MQAEYDNAAVLAKIGAALNSPDRMKIEMKRTFVAILVFFALSAAALGQQQKPYTTADYDRAVKMLAFSTSQYVDRGAVRPNFLPDGRFWYRILTAIGSEYVLVNPANGSKRTEMKLSELGITPTAGGRGMNPFAVASPDGTREAYIKDFNLWVKDIATGKETQLTTDGVKDYGYATDNAGWKRSPRAILVWSPDSKRIATFQQDERNVSDAYLVPVGVGAQKLQAWKSALPGDPNVPMIERVVIDVDAAKVTRLQVAADPHRSTVCDDISCDGGWDDVYWADDSKTLSLIHI